MPSLPLQFLLLTVAGWMPRDLQRVTEYLLAENAVLRDQLRGRRIRYTDGQQRRLAAAAKKLGRAKNLPTAHADWRGSCRVHA